MSLSEIDTHAVGGRVVSYDLDDARAKFRRESFVVEHTLADHPLFTLEALGELADRLPEEVVEHNVGKVNPLEPGGKVPKLDLPPGEIVRGIETNGCWIVLPIVLADGRVNDLPGYQDVYDRIMDDVAPMIPGGRASMSGFHSVIFVAARESVTPSHLDGEIGFLLHIRGDKRLSIGRYPDAELERSEIEAFHRDAHRNTNVLPVDVRDFDLRPGQGVHVPPLKPHWVTSGAEVAISLSVGFQTPDNLRRAGVHEFNARVRGLGVTPKDFGASPVRDHAKAALVQAARQAKRRVRRP